jgi:uncharacterized lipoprotein YddW (UPF0748 family)
VKRRSFVRRTTAVALGIGLAPRLGLGGTAGSARGTRGWTWVHGGEEQDGAGWRERFARLREAGIVGTLVGGGATDTVGAAAHAEGLEYHRWLWVLNRSGDSYAKENHPEWFTVNRLGQSSLEHPPYVGYYQWLCPTRPAVRDYLRDIVDRIAAEPGIDGVHLDYIRHADVILPVGLWEKYDLVQNTEHPEFDFCYCDVCRETFARQTGRDPLELSDPTQDVEWREFRWQSVTGLVEVLAEAVHARGKPISAAVFPTPKLARRLVRQAWDDWPLDAFFPMIYHSFYNEDLSWIASATAAGVAALPSRVPLYSGLYLPSLTPDELGRAAAAARGAGAAGVSLFALDGLSEAHLKALEGADAE